MLTSFCNRPTAYSFFIIAFANYVDIDPSMSQSFSGWLRARTEIWKYVEMVSIGVTAQVNIALSQIMFLRKTYGSRLNIFHPINDLSALSKSGSEARSLIAGQQNDVAISGGQILGDEYSDHVVKVRFPSNFRPGMNYQYYLRHVVVLSCERGRITLALNWTLHC